MDKFNKDLKAKFDQLNSDRDLLRDELQTLRNRLSDTNNAISGLKHFFKLEGISVTEDAPSNVNHSESKKSLADFLKELMKGGDFYDVDHLITSVKSMGYDFGEKNPYRSINFTLMGLKRGGDFKRDGDGWRYNG